MGKNRRLLAGAVIEAVTAAAKKNHQLGKKKEK
jgi:hypothetical protein